MLWLRVHFHSSLSQLLLQLQDLLLPEKVLEAEFFSLSLLFFIL
jgi:hypothetical protein